MSKANITEIVKALNIRQKSHMEGTTTVYEDKLIVDMRAFDYYDARNLGITKEMVVERKAEILAYFSAQREEDARKYAEYQAKLAAIPGLREIDAAVNDLNDWQREFEKSFEDVGGLGVRPRPQYDLQAMAEQYPIAAAYRKARSKASGANYELAAIGKAAMDAILDHPEQYAEAVAKMEEEISAFADRHFWN